MTTRLSRREIDVLAAGGGDIPKIYASNLNRRSRTYLEIRAAAVEELRDSDLSAHDHRVLQSIRDRLELGEERDLLDRLIPMTAPGSWP